MNNHNASVIDAACKESLHELLRPQLYNVIEPWMTTASTKDKVQVVHLAKIAHGDVHVKASKETIQNGFGKKTPTEFVHQSLDRAQSDLFRKSCNAPEINRPLSRRRRHFHDYEETPSGGTVSQYFRLNNSPVKTEGYAKLLNAKASDKLSHWQHHADHTQNCERAQVVESLRNLQRAVTALPTYTEHLLKNPRLANGPRGNALYQYSKKSNWVPPLRRTESGPAEFADPEEDPEISNITKPGGYRVKLTDTSRVQFLKNKQRSMTCKVVMMGGSGAWQSTYSGAFPAWMG